MAAWAGRWIAWLGVVTALLASNAWAGDDNPGVRLPAGALAGTRMRVNGVALDVYRGVPFAAPPVGPLRWRPPQPVAPWRGMRAAQAFGPRCMQLPLFDDMVFRSAGMSEDCLYLNVWTPAGDAGARRPVLVYFYGGGFVGGDGSEHRYDGASLASRGLVTVTVNYRLGAFGFLSASALDAESPRHASGNYGLLDQSAALRWVHDHIARFGGDPAQVTIGGESAGSMSVSGQMASPRSHGLFARAIGESGALFGPLAPRPHAVALREGDAFMRKLGAGSLNALRRLPADALLKASGDHALHWRASIDGDFFTQTPAATFARGAHERVPLLVGSNSQEASYKLLLKDLPPTPANYRVALARVFGHQADRALTLYPAATDAQVRQVGTELASDLWIAHATWQWMDAQRRSGEAPVYYYWFAQPRPGKRQPTPGGTPDAGATHSSEIEYALGNLDTNHVYAWTPTDHAVSRTMEGYVANFIRSGDPNGTGLPVWPPAKEAAGGLPRQDIGAHTGSRIDRGRARQAFLKDWFESHPMEAL